MDKLLDWKDMTRKQQLNVTINKEAEEAFEKVVENYEYIKPSFPHKRLVMKYGQAKVTASTTEAIYDWKKKDGRFPFFQEMNVWWHRGCVFRWLVNLHNGKNVKLKSLRKACKENNITQPSDSAIESARAGIEICEKHLNIKCVLWPLPTNEST